MKKTLEKTLEGTYNDVGGSNHYEPCVGSTNLGSLIDQEANVFKDKKVKFTIKIEIEDI